MRVSTEFYNRLIQFYSGLSSDQQLWMTPIWNSIFTNHHQVLHEALTSSSPEKVSEVLESGQGLGMGISGADTQADELNDILRKVMVCVGLRPIQNPGQPFDIDRIETSEMLEDIKMAFRIDSRLDISWINHDGGWCMYRFPTSVYVAGTLQMLLGKAPERVIEIGPGYGIIGIILRGLGTKRYVAIDLPIGCVLVGWLMATLFGEQSVWFCNEPASRYAFAHIVSPIAISCLNSEFDVVINSDSFPEIPHNIQDEYFRLAHRVLSPKGMIYSINQESTRAGQRSISIASIQTNLFHPIMRKIFPLRAGYVEELFVKNL